jgi:hypothetical protein
MVSTILTSTCPPTVTGSNHPFGGISILLLRITPTCPPTVTGSNHPFGGISILLLRIKMIMQSRPESYCEI